MTNVKDSYAICRSCDKEFCRFSNRAVCAATEQICITCPYHISCKINRDYGPGCAARRAEEMQRIKTVSDAEILDYLTTVPSTNCPYEKVDIIKLAKEMAEEDCYQIYRCEIRPDFRDSIPKAKEIAAKKERESPSLNIANLSGDKNKCVDCPPEFSARCKSEYKPGGWIGFPDIYQKEAILRGIAGKIMNLR